jgi:hypothetical protein
MTQDTKLEADSLPERFTRETFVDELEEIGLEKDNNLLKAVDSVIKDGFISVEANVAH